jgi:hypothetical protein
MAIGFPEPRPSGTLTDATIISETDPLQEEAATIRGVISKPDKRPRVVALRGSYLNFFPFLDKFRFWQAVGKFSPHSFNLPLPFFSTSQLSGGAGLICYD